MREEKSSLVVNEPPLVLETLLCTPVWPQPSDCLDFGPLLRLRLLRYSCAGLRKMSPTVPARSALVARREEVIPVAGSQRRFSITIGLGR